MFDPVTLSAVILTAIKVGGPWPDHGLAMLKLAREEGRISEIDFERIKSEGGVSDAAFNAYASADDDTVDIDPEVAD